MDTKQRQQTFDGWFHLATKFGSNVSNWNFKENQQIFIGSWLDLYFSIWWSAREDENSRFTRESERLVVVSSDGYYWFSLIPFGSSFFGIVRRLKEGLSPVSIPSPVSTHFGYSVTQHIICGPTHTRSQTTRFRFGLRPDPAKQRSLVANSETLQLWEVTTIPR